MDIRKLQRAIVDGLEDVKGHDIVVFNTEALSPLFERVIIASGTSNRQTKALANSVRETVKSRGMPVIGIEGEDNGEWIVVDCGAAVAHIMQPAIRQYYHLEEIWGGKSVKLKSAAAGGPARPSDAAAPAKKAAAKSGAAPKAAPKQAAAPSTGQRAGTATGRTTGKTTGRTTTRGTAKTGATTGASGAARTRGAKPAAAPKGAGRPRKAPARPRARG